MFQEQHRLLSRCQVLVVKQLVGQDQGQGGSQGDHPEEGDEAQAIQKELVGLVAEVKDVVITPKKTAATEE